MPYHFEIPDEEAEKSEEWKIEHKKVCKVTNVGAIGGRFTWSFTATSLGCIIVLKCACGEKINLTDFESW